MPEVLVQEVERGLLFAESEALKAKLSDITVADNKAPGGRTRAEVWFGLPTAERERRYPFIVIDFIGMQFANDRAHSAQMIPVDYWPSEYATFQEYADAHGFGGYTGKVGSAEAIEWHPYNLMFQVATHARHRRQDMEMTARLSGTAYLPDRWGYLDVVADNSCRWLDRVSMFDNSTLEGTVGVANRDFSKVYTVSISAHVAPELPNVYLEALTVAGSIGLIDQPDLVAASWTHPDPLAT
jgi:hypothetical protein